MIDPEARVSEIGHRLKTLGRMVREDPRGAYPRWVFELDALSRELVTVYQALSRGCGGAGTLCDGMPQTQDLRRAILRLSSLTVLGGLGISSGQLRHTIQSVEEELQDHLERVSSRSCKAHNEGVGE